MQRKHILRIFTALLFIIFMFLSIAYPAVIMQSAREGLRLWATAVVPSLFPFLFAARALLELGADRAAERILGPVLAFLGFEPKGAFALAVSLLCGYPAGAKTLGDLAARGSVSPREGERLAMLCHTAGPLFVLGFASVVTGVNGGALLGCHYGGVLCAACAVNALYTAFFRDDGEPYGKGGQKGEKERSEGAEEAQSGEKCRNTGLGAALGNACGAAAGACLTVGGFIVFFSCVSGLIKPYMPEAWRILELSAGLEGLDLPRAAALISFSGLCVIAQGTAFLGEIRPKMLLLCRAAAGAFSLLLGLAAQASPFLAAGAAAAVIAPCCVFVRFYGGKRGIRAHYGKERGEEAKGRACAGGHKNGKKTSKNGVFFA